MSSVGKLTEQLRSIDPESLASDPDLRRELIDAAESMVMKLQTPAEFIERFWSRQPGLLMCLRVAQDIGLFRHLGRQGSEPRSLNELVKATEVEHMLLLRITRHLAASNVINSSSPGHYTATHISEAFATYEQSSAIRQSFDLFYPAYLAMPKFLQQRGYRAPTNARDTVIQQQFDLPNKTLFECFEQPHLKSIGDDFDMLIQSLTYGLCSFLRVCDFLTLLEQRKVTSEHLFVDIGGGTGTDALAFRKQFNQVPGIVELQDVPSVIENARSCVDETLHLRVHDFFQPQPVKSARFYYMSSILHDWTDPDCKRILAHLADAMTPGYSTLLLHEIVLPETGCHPAQSAVDIMMMTVLASSERSENDWRSLMESSGFSNVRIHSIPSSHKSVIECELA